MARLQELLSNLPKRGACGVAILAAATAALLLAGALIAHGAPVSTVAPERLALTLAGRTWELPLYASESLAQADPAITHAIIVIHDSSRNARSAFNAALAAARAGTGALAIAPQFLTAEDAEAHELPSSVLRWRLLAGGADWEQGWDQGNDSDAASGGASSFAVLDALLERLADRAVFPSLRTVVVAGLSLGAQFVNRYAAATGVVDALRTDREMESHFVVAAPSSYLYFDAQRPVEGSPGAFAVPSATARRACPGWNAYRYGLDGLNTYLQAVGGDRLQDRYASRSVTYLIGENDHGGEQSCAARLQGVDRLARAQSYHAYLRHTLGDSMAEHHRLVIVAGIGHSWDLLSSPCGLAFLLGPAASATCGP